jgi:hypothetical protein
VIDTPFGIDDVERCLTALDTFPNERLERRVLLAETCARAELRAS